MRPDAGRTAMAFPLLAYAYIPYYTPVKWKFGETNGSLLYLV